MFLFSFSCFVAPHRYWSWVRRSHANYHSLLAWASLQRHRFFFLMSSFVWALFWKLCMVICITYHLILAQIWAWSTILFQHKLEKKTFTKILSNSRALSSSRLNNERGWRSLGTRPLNVWVIECSISSNEDLWNKIVINLINTKDRT